MPAPKGGNKGSFKRGKSGNPSGKPKKGETLTEILREYCDEITQTKEGDKVEIKRLLAKRLVSLALNEGYFPALRYIYDRLEGSPTLQAEIGGKDGAPLNVSFNVRYVDGRPEHPEET